MPVRLGPGRAAHSQLPLADSDVESNICLTEDVMLSEAKHL